MRDNWIKITRWHGYAANALHCSCACVLRWRTISCLPPLTGAVCVRDRLTVRFCQTLLFLGRCQLPNIRAQCCKTCSQPPPPLQERLNRPGLDTVTTPGHHQLNSTVSYWMFNNLSPVRFSLSQNKKDDLIPLQNDRQGHPIWCSIASLSKKMRL